MAERLSGPEQSGGNSKGPELQAKAAEVSTAKVEADKAQIEREAKAAAERLDSLKETKVETEKTPEKSVEKPEAKAEKNERQKPKVEKEAKPGNKQQRKVAFTDEITAIRAQLTPSQVRMSKLVHNRVVESASQALEETVFRPSLVLGGAVGALIVGGGLYLFAKVRGYPVTGSEFIVGLIVGGGLGLIAELILRVVSPMDRNKK